MYASAVTMVESARRATRDASEANRGTLRISAPVSFAQMHLAEPLARFAAAHPDTRLQLLLSDRIVDLIDERIDVAVRITKLKDSSLVARRLALTALQVCAAPSCLKQHGVPEAPEDLLAHNCLRYSLLRAEHEWRLYGAQGRLALPVRGNFETSSGTMLRSAVLAGLGLAMLPRFMIDQDLREGRLQAVLAGFMPRPPGIYAVQPQRRAEPARVRQLVERTALLSEARPLEVRAPRWRQPTGRDFAGLAPLRQRCSFPATACETRALPLIRADR